MEGNVSALAVLLLFAGIFIVSSLRGKKAALAGRKRKILEKFGTHEDLEMDREKLGFYMESYHPQAPVDEITWNDLGMDDVFQRINQCDSSAGEEILYDMLHHTDRSAEELEQLEAQAAYFAGQEETRCQTEFLLADIGRKTESYYIPPYMKELHNYRLGKQGLYRLLQAVLFGAVLLTLIFHNTAVYLILALSVCANLGVYISVKMKYEVELNMLGTLVSILRTGRGLAGELRKAGKEEWAERLEQPLGKLQKAGKKIEKMQSFRSASMLNEMGILEDYLLGMTLWHLTSYENVIRTLEAHTEEYMRIYQEVGRIDAAISVASFRQSLPFYTVPELTEGKENYMEMEELFHPLLRHPVANSLSWRKNCVITGSNASGKSTFIKAAAVNAILAQTIHTCAARSVKMVRTDVMTSMAVRDDILSGDSYFIKEIKYLKRMLEHVNANRCTLCIIDEILRGTNTKERIAASNAVLRYLYEKNCLVMVASHDQELTSLLGVYYDNYHFTENIGETDIQFDYKLRQGPAVSQNAIKLLEFTGFPREIVAMARQ